MTRPINLGTKFREKIISQYPAIDKAGIPTGYTVGSIGYKKSAIEEYDVIFWHRLLRSLYEEPAEIECEIQNKSSKGKTHIQTAFFRKTHEKNHWQSIEIDETIAMGIQAGKVQPFPINWKYLIGLPSGGIVELGTKDKSTIFHISQIILPGRSAKNDSEEAQTFIKLLLDEANRIKDQRFNPTKAFEKQEGIRMYLIFNVYLSNYLSAKTMLGMAEELEAKLSKEFLRYDARTSDLYDEDKRRYIDQHMLTCGMFYCSAITYFFMSLEGFINLVFHAFLKQMFRDKEFGIDRRFDLEEKLRLMPILCKGFNENSELPATVLLSFKKLRNYRNSLFHSNAEESLKSLCFTEDGFFYNYDMDKYKDHFLPAHKIKLTIGNVIDVNNMVDEIVNHILGSMNHDTKDATETYILREPHVPIVVLATGELVVGKTGLA